MEKIELTKEAKKQMIEDIKIYFSEKREEEMGDLAAQLLLNFMMEKIGPMFYNQAIRDAYLFMSDKLEDLYGLEK